MSIVAAAEPGGSVLGLALALLAAATAVVVAGLTGVLRVPPASLGARVPPARPLMPLVGVLCVGVIVWVYVPSLYYQFIRSADAATTAPATPPGPPPPPTAAPPTTTPPGADGLSAREVLAVNAAVPMLAFAAMALGDVLVRPVVGQRLGFGATRLPWGVVSGAIGILLALPLVYCVMVVTAWVYRLVQYDHPGEHELLRTMGDTPDPLVKYVAIVVAVAIAPLWEELLFRGHLQTLIREGLTRLRAPTAAAGEPPGYGFPVTGAAYELPPLATAVGQDRGSRLETWLAIVMTSLLFASVHAPWQFPPIFALSLCLGLAYERTGNLWVPVVMHALFNGLMTTFFLARGASVN